MSIVTPQNRKLLLDLAKNYPQAFETFFLDLAEAINAVVIVSDDPQKTLSNAYKQAGKRELLQEIRAKLFSYDRRT